MVGTPSIDQLLNKAKSKESRSSNKLCKIKVDKVEKKDRLREKKTKTKKKQIQRKNKCTFHNVPECNSFLGPRQFVVELKNKRCKETNKIKKLQACRSVREINYLTKR